VDRAGPDLFGFLDGAQSAESVPIKAGRPALTGAEWKEQAVRGQRLRAFVLVLLSLLAAGVFAVVARQSWTTSSADVRLVQDERARVAYLRPLSHLVGALTEAQSAAIAETSATVEEVKAETAWDLRVSETCGETEPPSALELEQIRRLDPEGFWTGARE